MADSLKGQWGRSYEEAWAPAMAELEAAIQATPLKVLSWGPGEHTKYYGKRDQIGQHLGQLPGVSVVTSEVIDREAPFLRALPTVMSREELHVQQSDLTICLEVDDDAVTGLPLEVSAVRNKPWLRERVRLLAPKDPKKKRGLLGDAVRVFGSDFSMRYTPEQYIACIDIRAKAAQWVAEVQVAKYVHLREIENLRSRLPTV